MTLFVRVLAVASVAVFLTACGTGKGERALTGSGIGAATGAAGAAVTGGSAAGGAILGGAAGAAIGALTDDGNIDFGDPVWE